MSSAVRPTNVARVSMLMQSDLLLNNVRTNSVDLLKVQNQLSTGLKLGRPSDSPTDATTIMNLDNMIERQQQYLKNISYASDYLNTTDSVLSQAVDLVQEAYNLASDSVGTTGQAGRESNAVIIDQIIEELISLGNTTHQDSYIFSGQNSTVAPFSAAQGGVQFLGNLTELQTRISNDTLANFSVDGQDIFGVLSSEVVGIVDLDPDITEDTLLSDLNGALGEGIRQGSILISDGTESDVVDLGDCVTVGDVIKKINNGTPATTTASITADGTGLQIASTVGTVTVQEVGNGFTARDLGIFDAVGVGGNTLTGQDVDARLSPATSVTMLAGGAGIDLTSGLVIQNSLADPIDPVDLSSAATVQDILNAINLAGIGVRAEINADGTGINIFNQLSGSEMSIGENGGTTATDLGIRSMAGSTLLSSLNGGQGIHPEQGVADIRITDRLGVDYDINLDSAATVQDVLDLINTAAGGQVTASLASVGNGIVLTDNTGGAGTLTVTRINDNGYFIDEELGLNVSASGNVLTGSDVNTIQPEGLFSHLIALRDALLLEDDNLANAAINEAAALVKADEENMINMNGKVGAQAKALEDRQLRIEDNIAAIEVLRSDIRDIDYTEAITRYQNLYTALQANLMTGSQLANVSLLDFLS
jgi:flagellar hook-associated protein 3 FlgL